VKYQLVLQFPIADASADDFDRLIMIENELSLSLKGYHDVDGHDIGSGEMNIFIHTDNPAEAFMLARGVLSKEDLEEISVAFREFDSDKFTLLWPENTDKKFKVM